MNITLSRISFGIRTFATVNFSFKEERKLLDSSPGEEPFAGFRHSECWHSTCDPQPNLVPRGPFCHALEKPIPVADQKDRGLWERDCPQPHKQFRLSLHSTDWKTTNKTFSEKCETIEAKIEGEGDWFFWVNEYAKHNETLWLKAQISSITYVSYCITWTVVFPTIWPPLCYIRNKLHLIKTLFNLCTDVPPPSEKIVSSPDFFSEWGGRV